MKREYYLLRKSSNRVVHSLLVMMLIAILVPPAFAAEDEQLDVKDIRLLRKLNQLEKAQGFLDNLLKQKGLSDETLRLALVEKVTLYVLMQDYSSAKEEARRSLEKYPDIEVDPREYPEEVVSMFDGLRNRMFGLVDLISVPTGAEVLLNGKKIGNTPLHGFYVRPGDYEIKMRKTGYVEEKAVVMIESGVRVEHSMSLVEGDMVYTSRRISFGVEAGIAMESLSYANPGGNFMGAGTLGTTGSDLRVTGGLFLEMTQSDKAAVVFRARYMNFGATIDIEEYPEYSYSVNHHCIGLSAIFKYYLRDVPRFYLMIGPEAGFVLSADMTADGGGVVRDIGDNVKGNQLLMNLGGGVEIPAGGGRFSISLSYAIGMLKMKESEGYELVNYKPRELKVLLGYIFN